MDIKYRLEGIAETEFRLNYEFNYACLNREKLQVMIGNEINPDLDNDRIAVKARVTIYYGNGEAMLASNEILMNFGLSPIKDIITIKDDGTFSSDNKSIIDTFLAAAMGTLRGVLMKNLKGSPLEGTYIPLIPLEKAKSK